MLIKNSLLFTGKLINKLVILALLLLLSSTLATAKDDTKENRVILESLYEKVVLKNLDKSLEDIKTLKSTLQKKEQAINQKIVKQEFAKLVKSWKSVETFYILGDLNEDFIDTPRYIDIFHNGNEDIGEQIDLAIKSSDEIKIALFKNSTKSINALEYLLFTKDIKNERINKIALTIIDKISSHINDIKEEYLVQKENFLKDLKKANAITINAIIQNTYKLKEWRVADVLGLSKKYEDKPDNRRAEYFLSKNSANAIEAVLILTKIS